MVKTRVEAGICGFVTEIEASSEELTTCFFQSKYRL